MKATLVDTASLETFNVECTWEMLKLGSELNGRLITYITIFPGSSTAQEITLYGYMKPKIRVAV